MTETNETKPEPKTKTQPSTLNRAEKAEIVKRIKTTETSVMNPVEYEQMKILANDFIASGSVPSSFDNASQVLMALQSGKEMGMSPVESMQSLYIVNGALNLWGKAVPRRLRVHGYQIGYQDETQESSTVMVKKDSTNEIYTETFTFTDAELSGWTKDKNGYLKFAWKPGINRRLKLRYGALSTLIKTYIPEVLGSVTDIVEVATDWELDDKDAAKQVHPAEARIKKALKAETLESTTAKPVDQEQDDEEEPEN